MATVSLGRKCGDVILGLHGKREKNEDDEFRVKIKDFDQISWFIGESPREAAEKLLEHRQNGTFLLRRSPSKTHYAISVRSEGEMRHFFMQHNTTTDKCFFGPEQFDSIDHFVSYMISQPIVNHDSDNAINLLFPYYKLHDVIEKNNRISLYDKTVLDSKRGFLTKRGAFHKCWKERWFVIEHDLMKYFNKPTDEKPLRIVDIRAAIKVEFSAVDGKRNAFCLGLPWRTFYFVGKSAGDTESWMRFFQGRINFQRELVQSDDS